MTFPGGSASGREPFALPSLRTAVPGPRSTDLARRLSVVESRNITSTAPHPPIFWAEAWNANVADVDGNVFLDMTSGFGVAFAGHSNPAVTDAIAAQAARLAHGLGDVYPPDIKVTLLEKLASLAPGDLSVSILGSDGADAVEAALKTALIRTGRPGVVAFTGSYHGLTYGALATTWREDFRAPFQQQLNPHVWFAPYPAGAPDEEPGSLDASLGAVKECMAAAEKRGSPVGAIIVEPIQGRGGVVVPPDGFLRGLRDLCDGTTTVLIFDEIYTGMGRTGKWFASEWAGVVPDIATIGKALTGSIALSAAIGTPEVMSAWPPSTGEAIHTSTFLGNPTACAAALAQISEIERQGLLARSSYLGVRIESRTRLWVTDGLAVARRGVGLLQGVRLPSPQRGLDVVFAALQDGVLLLPDGDGSILSLTPPACIQEQQLDHALTLVESILRRTA